MLETALSIRLYTYPPVIACRKLFLKVTLRASLTVDWGSTCKRESTVNAISYVLVRRNMTAYLMK